MSWRSEVQRWALVELVTSGRLSRTAGQARACEQLVEARWCTPATRRDEVTLVEQHRGAVEDLLAKVFPEWRARRDALIAAELPVNARGAKLLREHDRGAARVPMLPARVNLKTAMAAVADHSKATLTERRKLAFEGRELTRDGTIRMRPHSGLVVARGEQRYNALELADVLGELIVTERALAGGTCFEGTVPRALLFVENLGPYVDVVVPPGFLVAYVPGWDVSAARALIGQFVDVPILHFGDLDPNGVEIMRHLRAEAPELLWVVPDFWAELVPQAQVGVWPHELELEDAPTLVRELARHGRWLEQEPIAIDPRFSPFLELMLSR